MRPQNDLIFLGSSASGGSFASTVQLTDGWVRTSFQVSVLNGSLNGTFTVQGSNDLAVGNYPSNFLPTNWNNIGSTQSVVCSFSVGTSALIPWFDTCYRWHRLTFAPGNGGNTVGSFSIRAESKNL